MNDVSATPPGAETNAAAFAFVKLLAAELSAGDIDLPAYPEVALRVQRALDDPNSSVEETAQIVGAEPTLAARLLAMANSAAFTHVGKAIGDLRSAIIRLGSNIVRSAAIAFALAQMRHAAILKAVNQPLKALWTESTHVAAICYVVAKRTRINPDEALLAGLLHGVGKLYVLARAAGRPELFADAAGLEDIVSGWHVPIGKAILENWNFPEHMVAAVACQEEPERNHYGEADLTDVLVCAKILAALAADPVALEVQMQGVPAFRQLRLDAPQCLDLLKHAELQIRALRTALGN